MLHYPPPSYFSHGNHSGTYLQHLEEELLRYIPYMDSVERSCIIPES